MTYYLFTDIQGNKIAIKSFDVEPLSLEGRLVQSNGDSAEQYRLFLREDRKKEIIAWCQMGNNPNPA